MFGLRFKPEGMAGIARVRLTLDDPSVYDDREGYDPAFLGGGFKVPLPRMSQAHDALTVRGGGRHLKYHNFTTAQSKSRRVPIFSACNLDGKRAKKSARSNVWHFDPRIDPRYQIIEECYGNAKDDLFSRGHMTRREDPVWGDSAREAEEDTFTVTNAAPQMQSHNSPIWLGLEDYVLKNARKSKQKACVLTGPVLGKRDPKIHGVKIPVRFWKIVAFIHDVTDDLSAVAYLDSQAEFLPDVSPAFVWGQYKGMQVPVQRIEKLTGLGFGPLRKADVLSGADATFAYVAEKPEQLILG
jgi:endonuclease G